MGIRAGNIIAILLLALGFGSAWADDASAQLKANNVLVVYNHLDRDSVVVRDRYLAHHPGALDVDLAAPALVGKHTISFQQFRDQVRTPLRRYLASNGRASQVACLVLTRGIPHRIEDNNRGNIGDRPSEMQREWLEKGDFTAASVDSELTLLWQDIERGESSKYFDAPGDGYIRNPYYGSTKSITSFDRQYIQRNKNLEPVEWNFGDTRKARSGWESPDTGFTWQRLTAGDIYLVSRIDGKTLKDAYGLLSRATGPKLIKGEHAIVIDADGNRDLDHGDYRATADMLEAHGWRVVHERTRKPIDPLMIESKVIAYLSFGANAMSGSALPDLCGLELSRGAIFNTLESFNGVEFGGATTARATKQSQVADFVACKGTFGLGNVWEPYTFSSANNELMLKAMLVDGRPFGEAAWSALPVLSWAQVVLGDPLGRITVQD